MRHIFVGGLAAVAIVLWPDFSNAQTTSVLASSLTGSGIQAIDAGYRKRYRSTYTSQRCANEHEYSGATEDVAGDSLAEKYAVLSVSLRLVRRRPKPTLVCVRWLHPQGVGAGGYTVD